MRWREGSEGFCDTASEPWQGEVGEQEREIHSFTNLLLPCDLPARLQLDEGGKDLYKAATTNDYFSNKITKASHKSAFPWARLKTQTHMPLPENDHMMKASHCLSTDEVLMKSQHQQVNYVSEMEAVG